MLSFLQIQCLFHFFSVYIFNVVNAFTVLSLKTWHYSGTFYLCNKLLVNSCVSNLGHTYYWSLVFAIQYTDVRPCNHIWDPFSLLINNCYPISPNILEYMKVIVYTINISSKIFNVHLALTSKHIINSLVCGAFSQINEIRQPPASNTARDVSSRIHSRSSAFNLATTITLRIYQGPPWWQATSMSKSFKFWSITHVVCMSKKMTNLIWGIWELHLISFVSVFVCGNDQNDFSYLGPITK